MGRNGYQALLARLVGNAQILREDLRHRSGAIVLNDQSLGFCTMAALTPPGTSNRTAEGLLHATGHQAAAAVRDANDYLKGFFAWDNSTRMNTNDGGVLYSFSGSYVTAGSGVPVSALKLYPTSPRTTAEDMHAAAALLMARKARYDQENSR
jgi:hypothetical protein